MDENPDQAARWLCDKHIVKMPLETAQILCTVHHLMDGKPSSLPIEGKHIPYKPTHMSHPSVAWASRCPTNYWWLVEHGEALCDEYEARYGRTHRSAEVIQWASWGNPINMSTALGDSVNSSTGLFPVCVPKDCMVVGCHDGAIDCVASYRFYYLTHKRHIATWKRNKPPWWE